MENIYNAIQNLYNMDKTTWQEVLAGLYNLVSKVENKFDLFELKFGSLLGEQVTIELKKMYDDGSLASLINDKLLKDINTKVDVFKTEISEQLDTKANKGEVQQLQKQINDFQTEKDLNPNKDVEVVAMRTNASGYTFKTATERINRVEKNVMKCDTAYGDYDILSLKANHTISNADYSVVARYEKNVTGGIIDSFKIKLNYIGGTCRLVKFNYDDGTLSNLTEDTTEYTLAKGDNEIRTTSKFFVSTNDYVGIKIKTSADTIQGVNGHDGISFIGVKGNNTCQIVSNFALVFDYSVVDNYTFNETRNNQQELTTMSNEIKNVKTGINEIRENSLKYKTIFNDYDNLSNNANHTINKDDFSVVARNQRNDIDGVIDKFKIKLRYVEGTCKLVKFNYDGLTVTNLIEDQTEYKLSIGDNEISTSSKFFVKSGDYVGVKITSTVSSLQGVYPHESLSLIGVTNSGGCKIINNYGLVFDFSVTDEFSYENNRLLFEMIKSSKCDGYWVSKKYVAYGDSITAGYNLEGFNDDVELNNATTYVKLIANDLGMTFKNLGQSGRGYSISKTWNLANIINAWHPDADLVTVAMGTNDFGLADVNNMPFGEIKDKTSDTFCGNVRLAFDKLVEYYHNALVVIITPIPRPDMNIANSYGKKLIDYTDAIIKIAEEYSFPILDMTRHSGLMVKSSTWLTSFMEDNLHLTQRGQIEKMKPRIKSFINNLMS